MSNTTSRDALSEEAMLWSPEFWLFRLWPIAVVVPTAVVAFLASVVSVAFHAPLTGAAGIGVGVFALGTTPIKGRTIPTRLGKRAKFLWNRNRLKSTQYHAPFDIPHSDPGGSQYGTRWDGDCLLTMVRIDTPAREVSALAPGTLLTDSAIPLATIAHCLTQFDIGLAGIDVICRGGRTGDAGPVSQLYSQILGPLPAPSWLTTWLVLRLDPLTNAEAIANRGGGEVGVIRAATVATRRVVNRLAAHGLRVSVLNARQIHDAVRQLTDGVRGDRLVENWHSAEQDGLHLTTFHIDAKRLDQRVLTALWSVPSVSTTLTVQLRPAHAAGGRPGEIALSALVRFDTPAEPTTAPSPGLRSLAGDQYRALVSTLPLASQSFRPTASVCFGTPEAYARLALPIRGCGQLIGADELGRGVAAPLVGARKVEILAGLQLTHQIIVRAVASGARVVVHTGRAGAWRAVVDSVAAPSHLVIAGSTPSLQMAPTMVVFDGVPPTNYATEATVVVVRPRGKAPECADADLTLVQSPSAANLVTIRTATRTVTVQMIATTEEMRYLGGSFTSWGTAAAG
jgi:type VII secretion protein EccE